MKRKVAPRFGIGEWYGRSFQFLTAAERKQLAEIAITHTKANAPACPFKPATEKTQRCTKSGGICSLRLYESLDNGESKVVGGSAGKLRVLCPHRFKQSGTVYAKVSEFMLGITDPRIAPEVRFLRRPQIAGGDEVDVETSDVGTATEEVANPDDPKSEDVGNIDIVLVDSNSVPLKWCALEIQAVYFSGEKMKLLFEHIKDFDSESIPFPDKVRRPDYRSSGPKRLMPQLQIKVPTLRRWGKKMAVVVDLPWFETNVVGVDTVADISNADIAWFLIDFDESTDPATLLVTGPAMQTLERAVEGLTGGYPVTLAEFESKIQSKLEGPSVAGRPKVKLKPTKVVRDE